MTCQGLRIGIQGDVAGPAAVSADSSCVSHNRRTAGRRRAAPSEVVVNRQALPVSACAAEPGAPSERTVLGGSIACVY